MSVDTAAKLAAYSMGNPRYPMVLGAVVAVATVVGASDDRRTLADLAGVGQVAAWHLLGSVGIVLRDVVELPNPVPCRGMLGWWRVPEMVEFDISANLGRILAYRIADGSHSDLAKTDP